jgi:site-specific recombinase XerC
MRNPYLGVAETKKESPQARTAQLTIDDVQGGRIWILRVKRGVPGGSKQLLHRYLVVRPNDGCRYLFRTRRRSGTPISGSEIDRLFHEYAAAADLPASRSHVHMLRHSIGTKRFALAKSLAREARNDRTCAFSQKRQ